MVHQLMGSGTAAVYEPSASHFSTDMSASSNTMDMTQPSSSTICRHATLKKIKTNKNKFFVLHKDSTTAPARLEYYDSESNWNKKKKAKRTIYLRTCLSVSECSDARVKYGITIYTKDDSFQIGFSSEQTRDMWLADMKHLGHTSPSQDHTSVEHMWSVRVQTRSMKSPFEGDYKLCLNGQQASLLSKGTPEQVLALPLDVITHCVQNNKYFALEVSHLAQTGPGEIWMELEDSLIAQHVHRAFLQKWSLVVPGEDSFRPVSRSLSSKDKNGVGATRLRSGSDAARLRNRTGQSLYKYNPMALSPTNFNGVRRERSDSVDSYSTTTSLSTDESDYCHWQSSSSRSVTPDHRAETDTSYMPMNMTKKSDECKCLSSSNSLCSEATETSKPQDRNCNIVYTSMNGSPSGGYIDMTVGQTSPTTKGYKLKPDPVKCYLSEEGGSTTTSPKSYATTKGRPQAKSAQTTEYVEMCRKHMLTGKDKSSSAPHLIPTCPQLHSNDTDLFMNLEFENRDRTSSLSTHRPRGASWSQSIRPRSSTTEHKRRPSRIHRAMNNLRSTDYIDMTSGSRTGSYVEMSLDKNCKQRLELARNHSCEKEDKENHIPQQHSPRVPPIVTHPFPELLSASSEDDVSLDSIEGSISLHSLTSSADSMSTSSHSSHHSSALTTSLDAEPYVAMQPTPISSQPFITSTSHRLLLKPARVTSYIVDDMNDTARSKRNDYVEMSPSANKHTKQ